MIKIKTFGTDIIGISIWESKNWSKNLEINTFLIDLHFSADCIGIIDISIRILRMLKFGIYFKVGSGV